MEYKQDEFLNLMEAVDDQGGEHLDEMCKAKVYSEFTGRHKVKTLTWAGCGQSAIFEVPYEPENQSDAAELALVRVCAVEDSMGAWPRFSTGGRDRDTVYPYDPRVEG